MNIFLDKSLPKKTRILLQVVRVVLLTALFGGIYYSSINPVAGDILLYASMALMVVFIAVKFIYERRRKNLAAKEQPDSISENIREQHRGPTA